MGPHSLSVDIAAAQKTVVLAVGDDQFPQGIGLPHGRFHHAGILHAPAVIGEGDHLGGQSFHIGKNLPLLSFGNGGVGVDGNAGTLLNSLQLGIQILKAVRNRIQVGHGAHRGVAPMGRRPGAGENRLLIRKTRLSEMHMHITKAG